MVMALKGERHGHSSPRSRYLIVEITGILFRWIHFSG
jgi:hypothetical protein